VGNNSSPYVFEKFLGAPKRFATIPIKLTADSLREQSNPITGRFGCSSGEWSILA